MIRPQASQRCAIASLKLKHVDLVEGVVEQDAREVKTKATKTITTWFFPVGESNRQIVADWVEYLLKEKFWGFDDPLFPATQVAQDANRQFAVTGVSRRHWASATPIRGLFKATFAHAGLSYFNPHSFRKTLALLGERICQTPEQFKAWSQNLGHDQVMTTLTSYGAVARHRQAEIMRELQEPQKPPAADEDQLRQIAEEVFRAKSATGSPRALATAALSG